MDARDRTASRRRAARTASASRRSRRASTRCPAWCSWAPTVWPAITGRSRRCAASARPPRARRARLQARPRQWSFGTSRCQSVLGRANAARGAPVRSEGLQAAAEWRRHAARRALPGLSERAVTASANTCSLRARTVAASRRVDDTVPIEAGRRGAWTPTTPRRWPSCASSRGCRCRPCAVQVRHAAPFAPAAVDQLRGVVPILQALGLDVRWLAVTRRRRRRPRHRRRAARRRGRDRGRPRDRRLARAARRARRGRRRRLRPRGAAGAAGRGRAPRAAPARPRRRRPRRSWRTARSVIAEDASFVDREAQVVAPGVDPQSPRHLELPLRNIGAPRARRRPRPRASAHRRRVRPRRRRAARGRRRRLARRPQARPRRAAARAVRARRAQRRARLARDRRAERPRAASSTACT